MKSSKLNYAIVRTHGLRTHLIQPILIDSLIKAENLSEVRDLLIKTDYGDAVGVIPEMKTNASTLEKVFQKKLINRYTFTLNIVPKNMNEFLNAYFKRFEVENIKRILRAKHTDKVIKRSELIPLDRRTDVNFDAMLRVTRVDEAVKLLRETLYGPLVDSIVIYKETGLLPLLEAYLDRIYYINAWAKLDSIGDTNMAYLFGLEVGIRNINTIIALKWRGVESATIKEVLIPIYFGVNEATLKQLIEHDRFDLPSAIHSRIARSLAEHARTGDISRSEHLLTNWLFKEANRMLQKHPFERCYIYAYLILCERETKNLTMIVTAKQLRIPEERIRANLYI